MVNKTLKRILSIVVGAGIEGKFEIRTIEVEDSSGSNMAAIAMSPQDGRHGEVKIFLYKEETEVIIFVNPGAGMEFAEKVRDEILSHPEILSCTIANRER